MRFTSLLPLLLVASLGAQAPAPKAETPAPKAAQADKKPKKGAAEKASKPIDGGSKDTGKKAPNPAPTPKPAPKPTPAPDSKPAPAPAPAPVPTKPAPAPKPGPAPTPKPAAGDQAKPAPAPARTGGFMGNKASKVYHTNECKVGARTGASNRVTFMSKAEAVAAGYQPCKICKP